MKFTIEVWETVTITRDRRLQIDLDAKDEEHARALVERAYELLPRESMRVVKESQRESLPSIEIRKIAPAT